MLGLRGSNASITRSIRYIPSSCSSASSNSSYCGVSSYMNSVILKGEEELCSVKLLTSPINLSFRSLNMSTSLLCNFFKKRQELCRSMSVVHWLHTFLLIYLSHFLFVLFSIEISRLSRSIVEMLVEIQSSAGVVTSKPHISPLFLLSSL